MKSIHIFALLLFVISSASADECTQKDADSCNEPMLEKQQVIISQEQYGNLGITTGPLEPIENIPVLFVPAKVVIPPNQDFIVSSMQAGIISKLNVSIGDHVTKGQVLAVMNSAELLALQRQYLQSISELRLARAIFQRDKKMLDEGIIAGKRWEESKSRFNITNSSANEAKQLLQIAGMSDRAIQQLANSRRLSSQLDIVAFADGIMLESMAVLGARVDNQSILFRQANIDRLWVEIKMPQERLADIKLGDLVKIVGTSVTAKISLLGQSVDQNNQTVLVRALIENSQTEVRPGQNVNTQIINQEHQSAFLVPNEALSQHKGQAYIFVSNDQGFLVAPVSILGKQDAATIVTGKLTGKEQVALRGGVALKANWLGLGSEE